MRWDRALATALSQYCSCHIYHYKGAPILPQRGLSLVKDHSQVLGYFSCEQHWKLRTPLVALQFWIGVSFCLVRNSLSGMVCVAFPPLIFLTP